MDPQHWPADWLRDELRKLNRAHMADSHLAHLRGRDTWPNLQPDLLREELEIASRAGISPLGPDHRQFAELLNSGQRFNWAVLPDGSIRIAPSITVTPDGPVRISHAVLCYNGGEVLAAGEGRGGEYLSHTTGHYKCEEFVVAPVRQAFAAIGISFEDSDA